MYDPKQEELEKVDKIFTFHPMHDGQGDRYATIRATARQFAHILIRFCPPSRELSNAITALQDCVMWANAAIAINEAAPNEKV